MSAFDLFDDPMDVFLHACPHCGRVRKPGREDCRRCGASAKFCRGLEEAEPLVWNLDDLERAATILDRLLVEMPWSSYALELRITVAVELGDVRSALRRLRMLFDCATVVEDALWSRARVLAYLGDHEAALSDLGIVRRRYPKDDFVLMQLARVRKLLDDEGECAA